VIVTSVGSLGRSEKKQGLISRSGILFPDKEILFRDKEILFRDKEILFRDKTTKAEKLAIFDFNKKVKQKDNKLYHES